MNKNDKVDNVCLFLSNRKLFLMEKFGIQKAVSFLLVLLLFICFASSQNDDVQDQHIRIRVGLVLNFDSVEGKTVRSSASTALSDFYAINSDYKTRVSLSVRNSQGKPLLALASGNILHSSTFLIRLCHSLTI